jgi:hypothetical protein
VLLPLPARSSSPGPDVQSSTEQYRAVQSSTEHTRHSPPV